MGIENFYALVKEANLSDGLKLLDKPAKLEPMAPIPKPPKIPKIEKPPELKLTDGFGKSKAPFTHEIKNNSPYNER